MNGFERYRREAGLTQDDVAAALGVDRATVSRAEDGRTSLAMVRAAIEWSGGRLTLADFDPPDAASEEAKPAEGEAA